ncbi:MAG TPA: GTP cyclohydrolase MptA [Methanocorpusculum sp.]|nr:GTP cyclohydrolase MptA [Methanocorpusculum sp.]
MSLPDVQSTAPDVRISLTRVGVKNVRKLIEVARPGNKRPVIFISVFDVYVDLPSSLKGANLSRNFEVIDEVIQQAAEGEVSGIEDICGIVAKKLLDHHEYAEQTEVFMHSQYMLNRETPVSQMDCQEVINVHAHATAQRNGGNHIVRKSIGAEVTGITACPCAQNLMKDRAMRVMEQLEIPQEKIDAFFAEIPMATHNQRGQGFLSIETDGDIVVPLDKIVNVLKESMSAKIYELLKRGDESYVVYAAHKNARFVEDCVREMARQVVAAFPDLPGDTRVTLHQTNKESIHQHDAYAERDATLAELRGELNA